MLPSGLPETIDDDLVRFLVQSNQLTATSVKPAAFLPNPKDLETSVFQHAREPVETLWVLGLQAAGNRTLHGVAVVKASSVRAAQLDLASAEPPGRHAVIRGWPWNAQDPELQKAQQKEFALVLASAAGPPVRRNG